MNQTLLQIRPPNYPKPEPKSLAGQYCILKLFDRKAHAQALYDAFLLDVEGVDWTYLPYGPFSSRTKFLKWLDITCSTDDPLFYTVCVGKCLEPIGMVSLLNIEPIHGKAEIGHVHFSPKLQQTTASTEVHYLLMKLVFEDLGYRRLEWKCDNANERSKHCATRLGFTLEGLFRQHWIVKSRNRDTAWFSMLDKKWPYVKMKIERWLDLSNFNDQGHQLKKLNA